MKEKLIKLQEWCEKNSTYEKRWFLEIWFNRAYEERIEWACGLSKGYSRDYIDIGNNFFGDTPKEAIDKALLFIKDK